MRRSRSSIIVVLIAGCGSPPKVDDQRFLEAKIAHARFVDPCSTCHEGLRLAPSGGVAHGFGRDCGECHKASDTAGGTKPWAPKPYGHFPAPKACLGCHARDRPTTPSHPKAGDCAACHKFPNWQK